MLTEIKCAENAAQVAQRVAEALSIPIVVAANEITVGASGIATSFVMRVGIAKFV
jgi:hypothetical protein